MKVILQTVLIYSIFFNRMSSEVVMDKVFRYYEPLFFTNDTDTARNYQALHPERKIAFMKYSDKHLNVRLPVFGRILIISALFDEKYADNDAKVTIFPKKEGDPPLVTTFKGLNVKAYKGVVRSSRDHRVAGSAEGSISDGIFKGIIQMPSDTYYTEPARKYCTTASSCWFNGIIYRISDVLLPQIMKERCKLDPALCVNDVISPETEDIILPLHGTASKSRNNFKINDTYQEYQYGGWGDDGWRHRGQGGGGYGGGPQGGGMQDPNQPRYCHMQMIVDSNYVQLVGDPTYAADNIQRHAMGADYVFRSMDFNRDGTPDNVGVRITSFQVHQSPEQDLRVWSPDFGLASTMNFLTQLAYKPGNENFCLVFAVTHYQFPDERMPLGLANLPQDGGHNIGICSQPSGGMCGNTGVVYTNNPMVGPYPESSIMVGLTHEIGHTFGSPHDESPQCRPQPDQGGPFVMAPTVELERAPNNFIFSPCSVERINPVIGSKGFCFQPDQNSRRMETGSYYGKLAKPSGHKGEFCGDGIKEGSELCDCGDANSCSTMDKCCTPPSETQGQDTPCQPRNSKGYTCSIQSGPCCDGKTCTFKPSGTSCGGKADPTSGRCSGGGMCDGNSAECPKGADSVPDGTPCNGLMNTCKSGSCTSDVCSDNGKTKCDCTGNNICHVCCMNDQNQCVTSESLKLFIKGDKPVAIKAVGTSCSTSGNDKLVCNSNGKCVKWDHPSMQSDVHTQPAPRGLFSWFAFLVVNYWLYCVLLLLAISFGYGLFVGSKKFGVSRGGSHDFNKELSKAKQRVDKKYPEFKKGTKNRKEYELLCRLVVMFPKVSLTTLRKTVEKHKSEDDAIKSLVMKGHSVRRI